MCDENMNLEEQVTEPVEPKAETEPLFEEMVDFDTFSKSDFRVVKVKECSAVKKSKKLLHFVLDDGTGTDRIILSGIHAYYEPEELVGKTLLAITNLPPRSMMGIDSCGMLLSAVHTVNGEEKLNLVMLDDAIPQVQSSTNQKEYRKIYSVKADMRSKDFVSVFLLQQLLVTASRSGKEKEMNRKDVKKLLLAVIAVVIVAKIARDIMKARKQKENIPADIFEDFYEEEMNWWDKDLEEGEEQ